MISLLFCVKTICFRVLFSDIRTGGSWPRGAVSCNWRTVSQFSRKNYLFINIFAPHTNQIIFLWLANSDTHILFQLLSSLKHNPDLILWSNGFQEKTQPLYLNPVIIANIIASTGNIAMQYCAILHNIAQYCTILHNIAQYCECNIAPRRGSLKGSTETSKKDVSRNPDAWPPSLGLQPVISSVLLALRVWCI